MRVCRVVPQQDGGWKEVAGWGGGGPHERRGDGVEVRKCLRYVHTLTHTYTRTNATRTEQGAAGAVRTQLTAWRKAAGTVAAVVSSPQSIHRARPAAWHGKTDNTPRATVWAGATCRRHTLRRRGLPHSSLDSQTAVSSAAAGSCSSTFAGSSAFFWEHITTATITPMISSTPNVMPMPSPAFSPELRPLSSSAATTTGGSAWQAPTCWERG